MIEQISGMELCVFLNPSNSIVTVHFFDRGNKAGKPDIMAYLQRDMSWDVRRVVGETSVLEANREIVSINHESLGIELSGNDFDKFVRAGTKQIIESLGKENGIIEISEAADILENNSYGDD